MNAFKSGYGTVLYFEDSEVVEELQEKICIIQRELSNLVSAILWNVTICNLDSFGN